MTTSKDSQPMISCSLISHHKHLEPILRELKKNNFKLGSPCLSLKEGLKIKCDHIKKSPNQLFVIVWFYNMEPIINERKELLRLAITVLP